MCTLCLSRRRRANSHHHHHRRDPEHFPLKEIEGYDNKDSVDCSTVGAELPLNAIIFHELLHEGTFKTVHRAIVNYHPRGMSALEVAVKRLKDNHSELGAQELTAEVYILKSIQYKAGVHPHFVSLIGVTNDKGPLCLLLEYVPHGTLDRFLWSLKKGPIPDWYLRQVQETIQDESYHKHVACDLMLVMLQVADGMVMPCFLANHGFIHHDLSTRNVLVGPHLHIKIGNPGMFHEGYYYVVSEREHFLHDMAPECLCEKRFSLFSDVWSFGILVYKMVTLETNPYPGVPPRDLYNHIAVNNQRPRLLSSFSNELYFLLQHCWQIMPTERPAFTFIFNKLKQLCSDPTKHIILKVSKDHYTPGYVSENGQVFLHSVPPSIFQPGYSVRRHSNPVSSADDTIYSRENVDSMIQLYYSSEIKSVCLTQETDEDEEGPSTLDMKATSKMKTEQRSSVERESVPLNGNKIETVAHRGVDEITFITEYNDNSQQSCDQSCDHQVEDRNGSKEQLVYF